MKFARFLQKNNILAIRRYMCDLTGKDLSDPINNYRPHVWYWFKCPGNVFRYDPKLFMFCLFRRSVHDDFIGVFKLNEHASINQLERVFASYVRFEYYPVRPADIDGYINHVPPVPYLGDYHQMEFHMVYYCGEHRSAQRHPEHMSIKTYNDDKKCHKLRCKTVAKMLKNEPCSSTSDSDS